MNNIMLIIFCYKLFNALCNIYNIKLMFNHFIGTVKLKFISI